MKIDYAKLTADLKEAKEAAEKAFKGEDGGSANLDCMTIQIKRAKEKDVVDAIEASGLYTRGAREWFGRRFFISPPKGAQGNDRVRQVKAMCDVMERKGYNVLMFCYMD